MAESKAVVGETVSPQTVTPSTTKDSPPVSGLNTQIDNESLPKVDQAQQKGPVEQLQEETIANGPRRSKWRIAAILTALFLSLFVAAIDITIVATAIPVISHDLNSAAGYTWVGGAYTLANAIGSPIWAKLSDIWGRRIIMMAAIAVFLASSTVCATAQTMRTLIAGRALQGVASGGLLLLVHVAISDLFSVRVRSLFMGLTEGVWAVAAGVGPILGGLFASYATWRWCFYINLPIAGLAFFLVFFFLDIQHEHTSFKDGAKAIDWIGITAFVACTLLLLLGLDFGGVVFPWNSAKVIVLICVGAGMIAVFLYTQAKVAKYPLIPLHIFRDGSNFAALLVGGSHGVTLISGEYYFPLFFQAVKHASPLRSGILLVPCIVTTALVGILAGVIQHRTGTCRELIQAGTIILCLGTGLLILFDATTSIGEIIGIQQIFGIGSGLLFSPPIIAIQNRSEQKDVATATSTYNFVRSIAISISIILGGVVFQNSMDTRETSLRDAGLSNDAVERLSGKEAAANVALSQTLADSGQRFAVQQAFAWSMRNMWIMYTGFAALGVLASLFVKKSSLRVDHTETVTGIKREKAVVTEDDGRITV